jgi:hypothetical protein
MERLTAAHQMVRAHDLDLDGLSAQNDAEDSLHWLLIYQIYANIFCHNIYPQNQTQSHPVMQDLVVWDIIPIGT